jgi:hypothetical protein
LDFDGGQLSSPATVSSRLGCSALLKRLAPVIKDSSAVVSSKQRFFFPISTHRRFPNDFSQQTPQHPSDQRSDLPSQLQKSRIAITCEKCGLVVTGVRQVLGSVRMAVQA